MLHILFTILKIIGMMVGILFVFLIVMLLFTVFLPVQYRLDAEKYENWKFGGRISWLFHIFVFSVQYQEENVSAKFCIFGIPVKWKSPEEREEKRQKKQQKKFRKAKKRKQDPPSLIEKTQEQETAVWESGSLEGSKEENPPKQAKSEKETVEFEAPNQEPSAKKETFWEKCRRSLEMIKQKAEMLPGKIQKKFRKIQYTFQSFYDKIGDIRNKITEIKELIMDENNIAAFLLCKEQIFILLKHMAPRKKKGKIEFGLEDPADTGYLLGCISVLYAAIGEQVQICPNFEEEILEGELMLKGRLQLFVMLKIIWKLYRDKNIKQLYQKFKS